MYRGLNTNIGLFPEVPKNKYKGLNKIAVWGPEKKWKDLTKNVGTRNDLKTNSGVRTLRALLTDNKTKTQGARTG